MYHCTEGRIRTQSAGRRRRDVEALQLCYWELMKKRINMKLRLDSRNMRNDTTKDADKQRV